MAKLIRLTWTGSPEPDVQRYSIKRAGAPNATAEYASVPVGTHVYEDRGAGGAGLGDGVYYYRITAVDTSANESAYSAEVSQTIDQTAPSAPTGLAIQVLDFTP